MNSYLISRIRHHGNRASYIFWVQLALFTALGVTAQDFAQFDSVQVDNVLSVDELQVSSGAFVDGDLIFDSNPSKVLNAGNLLTRGSYLSERNKFTGLDLMNPATDNVLASAHRRFTVTTEPVKDVAALFNGAESFRLHLQPGETLKLRIDFSEKQQSYIAYGGGNLYLSAYHVNGFKVNSAKVFWRKGVKETVLAPESLRPGGNYADTLWKIRLPGNLEYTTAIELTLEGQIGAMSTFSRIDEIEYYLSRPHSNSHGSAVSKYRPESLFHDLSFWAPNGDRSIQLSPEEGDIRFGGSLLRMDGTPHNPVGLFGADTTGSNLTLTRNRTIGLSNVNNGWLQLRNETGTQVLAFDDNEIMASGGLDLSTSANKPMNFRIGGGFTTTTELKLTEGKATVGGTLDVLNSSKSGPSLIVRNTFKTFGKPFELDLHSPFQIQRTTRQAESYSTFLDDGIVNNIYQNDERGGSIRFGIKNTDSESGGGANANESIVLTLAADQNGGRVRVDGSLAVAGTVGSSEGGFKLPDGTVIASAADLGSAYSLADPSGNSVVSVSSDGNVGIGTQNPSEKLHVAGAVTLGTTTTNTAGTIRYDGSDFQGYDGTAWKSLVSGAGSSASQLVDANGVTVVAIDAESGDFEVKGQTVLGQSQVQQDSAGRNTYFQWNAYTPSAALAGEGSPAGATVPNQAIYVEFADKRVWGALTVTIVGDWRYGKNTGMIRKTFGIGRNSGWETNNDGEVLEHAIGAIVGNYRIGSPSSVSGGLLRIPIYKITDSNNPIAVFVEGHLSLIGSGHNLDPQADIALSEWTVVDEDYGPEYLEMIISNSGATSETPGAIRYDGSDFQGYDGTVWKSLSEVNEPEAFRQTLSLQNNQLVLSDDGGAIDFPEPLTHKLTTPDGSSDAVVVDINGAVTLMAAQGDIPMFGQ